MWSMETLSYLWHHIGLPIVYVVFLISVFALFLSTLGYLLTRYAQWLVDRYG